MSPYTILNILVLVTFVLSLMTMRAMTPERRKSIVTTVIVLDVIILGLAVVFHAWFLVIMVGVTLYLSRDAFKRSE